MRNEFLNTTIADTDPEVSEAMNKEDDEKMRNDSSIHQLQKLILKYLSQLTEK